jgi:hypothetical protein
MKSKPYLNTKDKTWMIKGPNCSFPAARVPRLNPNWNERNDSVYTKSSFLATEIKKRTWRHFKDAFVGFLRNDLVEVWIKAILSTGLEHFEWDSLLADDFSSKSFETPETATDWGFIDSGLMGACKTEEALLLDLRSTA